MQLMAKHLNNTFFYFFLASFSWSSVLSGQNSKLFVKPGATGPSGDSWATAFGHLQQAIDSAHAGDSIWVASGEYFPTKIFDTDSNGIFEEREKTFYINKNIALYGGFAGDETSLSERDPDLYEVLLNGDIGIVEDSTDDVYHVVFIDGTTPSGSILRSCLLDGFEIEYGNSSQSTFPHQVGSAIFINGNKAGREASPTIRRCVIAENYGSYGGTVYNDGRNGTCRTFFDQCLFEDNFTYSGGGVINNGSGGVCDITFRHCEFTHNYTSYAAGAIWNFNINGVCSLEVINCVFDQNESDLGGAIYNFSHMGISWSRIVGSEFYLNKAHSYGGAIFNYDFQGVHTSEIINCTFYKNIGWHEGGAIRNWNTSTAAANCIFWDNGDEIHNNDGAETALSYSVFDDGTPNGSVVFPSGVHGQNNIDSPPDFIESSGPNLRLRQGSPGIEAGTPDTTGLHLPTDDLDGLMRVRNRVDIGAYENPFTNCPIHIFITPLYCPLYGTYEAQTSITVHHDAFIPISHQVILKAPQVIILPESIIENGAIFEVIPQSCSQ